MQTGGSSHKMGCVGHPLRAEEVAAILVNVVRASSRWRPRQADVMTGAGAICVLPNNLSRRANTMSSIVGRLGKPAISRNNTHA